MTLAGNPAFWTALDTAIAKGITVDLAVYGVKDGGVVEFHPIPFAGLGALMAKRRSNAHMQYERDTQRLMMQGTPIDYRLRAADMNTLLFGRGPQDLVAILTDHELFPETLRLSLRGRPLKTAEKDTPELEAIAERITMDRDVQQAVMWLVFELANGMKAPGDPTAVTEEDARRPDPTTPQVLIDL